MAIFIISRRPGEAEFSYRNRFTSDNAEVNGHSGAGRRLAYERLRLRADTIAMRWQACETETEFRVIDTGVDKDDRFEQPKDAKPVLNTKRAGRTAYVIGGPTPIKCEIVGDYDAAIYRDGTAPYVRVKLLEPDRSHFAGDVVDYGAKWVRA